MSSSRGWTPTLRRDGHGEDGEEAAGEHGVAEPLHQVVVGQRALLEELLDQRLVGLGHHLHEPLDGGGGGRLRLVRHVHLLELAALVVGVDVGPVREQVGHAHEALLLAQGDGHRHHPPAEGPLERLEGAGEARPVAIDPVDHDDAREVVLLRVGPDLLGLHLDSGHRVDHHQGRVGHAQGRARLGQEVGVAGGVEEIDLGLSPLPVGEAGLQADLPLDLVGVEIGGGGAVVHPAEAVQGPHVVEHGGGQGGLAAAPVAHEGDVADARSVVDLHLLLLRRAYVRTVSGFPGYGMAPAVLAAIIQQRSRRLTRARPYNRGMSWLGGRTIVALDATGLTGAGLGRGLRRGEVATALRVPLEPGALVPDPVETSLKRPAEVKAALAELLGRLGRPPRATLVLPMGLARFALLEPPPQTDPRDFARFRLGPTLPFPVGGSDHRGGAGRGGAGAGRGRPPRGGRGLRGPGGFVRPGARAHRSHAPHRGRGPPRRPSRLPPST